MSDVTPRERSAQSPTDAPSGAVPTASGPIAAATPRPERPDLARRILVAADGILGDRVAQQLATRWRVVVLDRRLDTDAASRPDPEQTPNGPGLTRLHVDATSRLVLERAGAAQAYCLIASMRDEQANLEACRLARATFEISKVVAVCFDATLVPAYEAIGVDTVLASNAVAALIGNRVESRLQVAEKVGLGQGEIVEVEVLPGSAVVERPLKTFSPEQWLVAAVYRGRELIVPHGDTKIAPHDRVLLVGNPDVLPAVADYFRAGGATFPQPYGSRLSALLTAAPSPAYLAEIAYLAVATGAESVDFFATSEDPTWRATTLAALASSVPADRVRWQTGGIDGTRAAIADLHSQGAGCLVVPDDAGGLVDLLGLRKSITGSALAHARCPVLVARGTFPYRRVLLAATTRPSGIAASHLAFRFAGTFGGTVTGLAVRPPNLVLGDQGPSTDPLETVRGIALAHDAPVEFLRCEGNPIVETVNAARGFDVLVIGHRPLADSRSWGRSILNPDVSYEVIRRLRQSVLVLPWRAPGG